MKDHLDAHLLCLVFGICQAHAQGWNYRVLKCDCSCRECTFCIEKPAYQKSCLQLAVQQALQAALAQILSGFAFVSASKPVICCAANQGLL